MSFPRVKIDVFDGDGNKISISLEGKITRNKVLHVLDLIELLGGVSGDEMARERSGRTKFDKLKILVDREFSMKRFTSQQVHFAYEYSCNEPITLSTVSTYLSRLMKRGF